MKEEFPVGDGYSEIILYALHYNTIVYHRQLGYDVSALKLSVDLSDSWLNQVAGQK